MSVESLAERFLGSLSGHGPFGLLGVSPRACSDEVVLSALESQLGRLAQHAQADSIEADEVRLALHAAAAQLLDPAVKRHLIAQAVGGRVEAMGAELGPGVGDAGRMKSAGAAWPLELEHDILLTLGVFGGWNRKSLHRLQLLAHARGMTSVQLAEALRRVGTRRRRTPEPEAVRAEPARTEARPVERREDEPLDRARSAQSAASSAATKLALMMAGGAAVLVLVVVGVSMIVGGIGVSRSGGGAGKAAPVAVVEKPRVVEGKEAVAARASEPVKAEAVPAAAPAAPAAAVQERVEFAGDVGAALRGLNEARGLLASDAARAGRVFDGAARAIAESWPRLSPDRMVASQDAVVEYIYRAGGAGGTAGASAVESIVGLGRGGSVWSRAWSSGMLARLLRERDLSSVLLGRAEVGLSDVLGPGRPAGLTGFRDGAMAALLSMPGKLAEGGAGEAEWTAWVAAVTALSGVDAAARSGAVLTALDTLLTAAPEPSANKGVFDAITRLVTEATWREGDESRRWLLRWFDDRGVSSADLFAVTSALAGKSGAPGVDPTMVVSASADAAQRAEVRSAYAAAWSLTASADRGEFVADWLEKAAMARAMQNAASGGAEAGGPVAQMIAAVQFSRLNEAATWFWRGETAAAAKVLLAYDAAGAVAVGADVVGEMPLGGEWGLRYLAAQRHIPIRQELLTQMERSGQPGLIDARVLVTEAMTGSPSEVRLRAQDVTRRLADRAEVVRAMLDFLPRAPRSGATGGAGGNAALVEFVARRPLPGVNDPKWSLAARRAVVERLLELLAGDDELEAVDRLEGELAASYASRASRGAPASGAGGATEPIEDSAGRLWAVERERALAAAGVSRSGLSVDEIGRRREARLQVAVGLVQEFAAEQVSVAELLAYQVAGERPDRADRVALVMADLARERRAARTSIEQVMIVERAMLKLWALRFGEDVL